jgi:glycosyltransferase involved in cell wall biosynthesis
MASGIPAVVTDVGDCSWLVGDTGAIVPPRDTDALVAALKGMLDLGEQGRRGLGLRARQRVIENFSLEQYVERHTALYEKALAASTPASTPYSSRD